MLHRPELTFDSTLTQPEPQVERRTSVQVVGTPIDVISWADACNLIARWAANRESRYVCICNVHSVMTAYHKPDFLKVIKEADLATPDGAPVAWMLRRLGYHGQRRINGPDLMLRYCAQAELRGEGVFLYGNTPETLATLHENLQELFPSLKISGAYSPPFRPLTPEEDEDVVQRINASGARTVWVSLGCPKQERWMAAHHGRIQAVMVGVGAAFDYHAGTLRRAPVWMQRRGLEWLHRLWSEPIRLGPRYVVTNTQFLFHAIRQLFQR